VEEEEEEDEEEEDEEEEDEEEDDEGQPILWSACNDRGSNVVKGMNNLFDEGEEENGEIAVPCDANNCVCHLAKGAVDALLAGKYGAGAFASDCTVVLGVSSALQRKSEGRDLLQDVATVETSHFVPLRKSDTRWEGLYQCLGRAIRMKDAWKKFFEDEEAGQQCLEKAGIKFHTDFPNDKFWERGEFYFELLTKAHAFSKWAQLERQPNMMFLVEKVASLVKYFALQDREDDWKVQCRKSFRKSFRELVMNRILGGDAPFALRAALFNPLIDLDALSVTVETVELCEKAVVKEMANFVSEEDKAEYDDASLQRILTLAWEQFKVAKDQFRKKLSHVIDPELEEMPFLDKVERLKAFWARPKHPFPAYLVFACRAYWSAPVASSKSESTFSYIGEVITKKRNKLSVQLSEAMTVAYDWSRQTHFGFRKFVNRVFELDKEYMRVKEKRKRDDEIESRALRKRLRELNQRK
jgi:hypothetical protein